jgi:hypothetical protein
MPVPGLSARYQPVNVGEIEAFQRAKQGLGADEPHSRRDLPEIVRTAHEPAVLNAYADPDIGMPRQHWGKLG